MPLLILLGPSVDKIKESLFEIVVKSAHPRDYLSHKSCLERIFGICLEKRLVYLAAVCLREILVYLVAEFGRYLYDAF